MKSFGELFTKQAIVFAVLILSIVAITMFSSYAFYLKIDPQEVAKSFETQNLRVSYSDNGYDSQINMEKLIPMSDLESKEKKQSVLTIFNKGNEVVRYQVFLVNTSVEENYVTDNIDNNKLLPRNHLRYQVDKGEYMELGSSEIPIYTGSIKPNTNLADTISIRIWVEENLPSTYKDNKVHMKFVVKEMKKNQYGEEDTLINKLISKEGKEETIKLNQPSSFNLAAIETEKVLFFDSESNNYYYRSGAINNNIVFGNDDVNELSWKIVSFNVNGSVKMVLNDTNLSHNLKSNYNNALPVLNDWYSLVFGKKTIKKHILESNYCLYSNIEDYIPSFNCSDETKVVTSKIGLLTADEYMFFGATLNHRNSFYYLSSNYDCITMSLKDETTNYVIKNNAITSSNNSEELYLRPVIIIDGKLNVKSGDGSISNPYYLEMLED